MLALLQKLYADLFLKPFLIRYLRKERLTKVRNFKLVIKPTVFHPKYFFSSIYLYDFVKTLNLQGHNFLEIGCGSGLISLLAYQKKAHVITIDINEVAVECTKLNFEKNFQEFPIHFLVLKSDLFDFLPTAKFDTIVINPPYFFEDVETDDQLAWNCGKNGEYFTKLFSGLSNYLLPKSEVYIILADNCEIDKIEQIAKVHRFAFELIVHKKIKWETNFIFKITSI
jgi:release factor glutamine methyltransferase